MRINFRISTVIVASGKLLRYIITACIVLKTIG